MSQIPQADANDQQNDESSDYSPLSTAYQRELEVEDVCCLTGEAVTASFCRFPDYRRGTMMVMSKKAMIENLRAGTTLEKFREVLVKRHGKAALDEYES